MDSTGIQVVSTGVLTSEFTGLKLTSVHIDVMLVLTGEWTGHAKCCF